MDGKEDEDWEVGGSFTMQGDGASWVRIAKLWHGEVEQTDFRALGRLELLGPVIDRLKQISGLRFKVEEKALATHESYVEQIWNFQGGTNCIF